MSALKVSQHLKIPLQDLEIATNNFQHCIGIGGYGKVYKGELSILGRSTSIAVKRLDEQFGQGLKEFLIEIQLLSDQNHPNLITLLGYCEEGEEKIIVYEYAANGSLDQYLRRGGSTVPALTWLERIRICVDAARGLNHLHHHVGKHQTVIHRDIKSSNILIDDNWVAKISDLGLSKLSLSGLNRSDVVSYACGTQGYCDPEYMSTGIVTKKSDVYSFGIVLFEVLCGKLCLIKDNDGFCLSGPTIKQCYEKKKVDEIVDPSIREQMSLDLINEFSEIAYRCLHTNPQHRLSMNLVVEKLEKLLETHVMGACLSNTKISGFNSNSLSTLDHQWTASATSKHEEGGSDVNSHKPERIQIPQHENDEKTWNEKSSSIKGVIPCGKIIDFGYLNDFDKNYSTGILLGHGCSGYIYVAIDKANGDRFAVKKIDKSKMILQSAVEDVKREVRILQDLSGHENVVQFHNTYEDSSYVYIVMELCEGGELLDRILMKKGARYSEKDAAIVARQMLKIAAECHLHGLVHRDMKPENFVFKSQTDDSCLKAIDFGLSDFIRPGKKFSNIVGNAYYMAPEVLKRKSGPEADVWSIGVITYILLCGRRPFWDKTEDGIFKEVLRNKPDYRRKPWPKISPSATDFVKKLLVKDPRSRLTAAQALSHPWVREGGNASDMPLEISVLANMREFVKNRRLTLSLRPLDSTLDEKELLDLKDQIHAVNVDKSGTISLEETKEELAKDPHWKMKESCVLDIPEAIDGNTDGLVDFTEFNAATHHVHQLEQIDGNTDRPMT
ncbi:hypothetical protein SSX86_010014 [Deinandra increscens subsp. villosa]|uniref:non-specific serine/threonine protein kinase n=1 Tax=Deinandra increscens subsp. villosa TaxID=3103831 RepID=A0AAP0H6A3_9ASTR